MTTAENPGAMTREHMADWFRACGVRDPDDMDFWLAEYAGKTEAEMDQIYSAMHGN